MIRGEARLAWALLAPALLVTAGLALLPLAATAWESLHRHDLRLPWLGRPFAGAANYREALADERCREALLHTALFTAVSVSLELLLGLVVALALDRRFRGRAAVRAVLLLPWAIPAVVAGLLFRFLFDPQTGVVDPLLLRLGLIEEPVVWLARTPWAWVPIVLADVWKTTPFVALLLLAGLQAIDPALHEAAAVDGAGAWRRLVHVTLPLLRPALLVALLFRTLDACRVFDLVYVLTGGGPGTATEPISLYVYDTLFAHLRFGYGAALAVLVFAVTGSLALLYLRLLGDDRRGRRA
jgi:ABC-type sugar transport system permease subunit